MTVIDSNNRPPFSASFDISYRPHITGLCLHKTNQIAEMILSPSLSPMSLDRFRVFDVLPEEDHHFDLARSLIELTTQSLEALHVSLFSRPPPGITHPRSPESFPANDIPTGRSEYLPIQPQSKVWRLGLIAMGMGRSIDVHRYVEILMDILDKLSILRPP